MCANFELGRLEASLRRWHLKELRQPGGRALQAGKARDENS